MLAAACQAQLSSTISLSNGVRLQVSADLGQPTGQQTMNVEMARASGNSFYRIFRDQNQLAVYAYELAVDLTPNGQALRATAKPATDEFAARYHDANGGKPVPTLSSTHEMGPLASGQSARLELFDIPGLGLKVSETILVKIGGEPSGGTLRFSGLRVAVDGKQIAGPAPGGVAGRFVMFYIPGRGAFFFSSEPVPGRNFVQTGVANQNRMDFTAENVDYECLSTAPIQGVGGGLWVLYDASYRPAGNWTHDAQQGDRDQFFVAASDSLGWWLP
jgi:hypothetical protein